MTNIKKISIGGYYLKNYLKTILRTSYRTKKLKKSLKLNFDSRKCGDKG